MGVAGIFAPVLAPHDPLLPLPTRGSLPPLEHLDGSSFHILGTDHIGRDVLSRLVTSLRTDLFIGLLGTFLGTLLAWLIVIVRGIRGAARDPDMPLTPLFGIRFHWLAILVFVCGVFLTLIVNASVGSSLLTTIVCAGMFSALLPMTLILESVRGGKPRKGPIPVAVRSGVLLFSVSFSLALLMGLFIESSVSFLGLGVPPSTPNLGNMVAAGLDPAVGWWVWAFPMGVLLVAMGAFSAIVIPVGSGISRQPAQP